MASWEPGLSGLKPEEIKELIRTLKSSVQERTSGFQSSSMSQASQTRGSELYANHCATCHGETGQGGIGLALNNKELLRQASDEYLYLTLVKGRPNTAMPGWTFLEASNLYDLVSHLRSWQSYSPIQKSVNVGGGDSSEGELQYHFLCSRCHGEHGQGQTGPAIINRGFLEAASDEFLYNTIAYGRGHSAMFGWSVDVYNNEKLEEADIGNIIAFLRKRVNEDPDYIYAGANPGNAQSGLPLFEQHCAKCHGNNGEGSEAPALNNQEFLNAASNGYIVATISIGREGTKMPRWGKESDDHPALSQQERADITAFIRNWQRIAIRY